ncbi:hypothetical protein COU01_02390 [Candidatus Falkowbacteria bacterium CG10_big_fil_rev_8_21_14_0_10_44_15]|uniref:Methyltransferase type 11 domain-containing protein n=1 Tax=Candidatus Falkowbacteria bacterium CG10_big_fil_rev_8_21_14_0_10_44_15 TaxID=1974569 RepID=A0A2H0UZN5_9BACT|nr:MAG: hypothetical protein COU01_02390 [Candidatus Falkowbacteria bacterium CG10_big_fil_rev_8_21_14_0_10_44_15]
MPRRLSLRRAGFLKTNVPKLESMTIENSSISQILELAPRVYEPEVFKKIQARPEINEFCQNFELWNQHVPWLVYADSQPHKELMAKLTALMWDKVGESCADFGCGYGEFLTHLLQLGDCTIRKYFAVDLDWQALVTIPRTLKRTSYCGRKVFLIHSAAMLTSPLRDKSVDSVISSLGALMYTWAWFDKDGNQVANNREAFVEGLIDVHRILKPGGYLGISAPLPNPNWRVIRNQSLKHLLLHEFSLKKFWETIYYGTKAVRYSRFMNGLEQEGKAHYLSPQEWRQYLEDVGFEIEIIETNCFARQGIIVIARKVN